MKNWLSMKRNGGTGTTTTSTTSTSSTAVVSDLNIEVKIVSWLWYSVSRGCGVPGLGRGLTGLDKSHERVQLMVRYLLGNSWMCGRRGNDGL